MGWRDSSAWAGERFGSTVIAGHVDSATEGIGFFARLLKIHVGDTVILRGDSHRLNYRVTSVRKVAKAALASDSQALKQTGPHRLVLITCTGNYHRDRGGYESNVVVVAKPTGLAKLERQGRRHPLVLMTTWKIPHECRGHFVLYICAQCQIHFRAKAISTRCARRIS